MKHSEYRELLSLADALTFISESELLWKLSKDGGSHSDLHDEIRYLLKVVGNEILSNLIA